MAFIVTYWYILAIIVVAIGLYVSNRSLKGQVRTHALKYLLAAEKLVFTTTETKLNVVSDAAYRALPSVVQVLLSPATFELIVANIYNEVKDLVDDLSADPSVPVQKDPTK